MSCDATSTEDTLTLDDLQKARTLFNQPRVPTGTFLIQVPEGLVEETQRIVGQLKLTSIIEVKPCLKKLPNF